MASEWRPIETAPKDGTPILLYCPGLAQSRREYGHDDELVGADYLVGWWGVSDYSPSWTSALTYCDGGVWDDPSHEVFPVALEPTHWMPLPEPPDGD